MTSKVYEIVTDKIIAALESGTPPWRKPWTAGLPKNAISNRPYSSINALLLSMAPYADNRWLTMKQANEKGGRTRKGEKSTLIIFWKQNPIKAENDNGAEIEKVIPLVNLTRKSGS
jgi:antirestriction protein ArdC